MYGDNKEEKVQVCFALNYVFATSLKLLHPFMPFITSELYTKVMEYGKDKDMVLKLGFSSEMTIKTNRDGIPENSISILQDDLELYMPAEGLIDMEEERNRLESEIKRLESEVARGEKMLEDTKTRFARI